MGRLLPTCSLCKNYDPNLQVCNLTSSRVLSTDHNVTSPCIQSGDFIRDINVIPESYHYFLIEDVPYDWQQRLPKDQNGVPLFVITKRGTERVLPVEGYIKPLIGDPLVGVNKIYTYQGQRELIYDLGVELAKAEAEEMDAPLQILPSEENCVGQKIEIQRHLHTQARYNNPQDVWLLDEGEVW